MSHSFTRYYRRDGTPYTGPNALLEWANDMKNLALRRVAHDVIGPFHISTVWLGLDHSFDSNGSPLIFETMIFCADDHHPLYDFQERYTTEAAARAGHHAAVIAIQQALAATEAPE